MAGLPPHAHTCAINCPHNEGSCSPSAWLWAVCVGTRVTHSSWHPFYPSSATPHMAETLFTFSNSLTAIQEAIVPLSCSPSGVFTAVLLPHQLPASSFPSMLTPHSCVQAGLAPFCRYPHVFSYPGSSHLQISFFFSASVFSILTPRRNG